LIQVNGPDDGEKADEVGPDDIEKAKNDQGEEAQAEHPIGVWHGSLLVEG
jgi:hypothetical protein